MTPNEEYIVKLETLVEKMLEDLESLSEYCGEGANAQASHVYKENKAEYDYLAYKEYFTTPPVHINVERYHTYPSEWDGNLRKNFFEQLSKSDRKFPNVISKIAESNTMKQIFFDGTASKCDWIVLSEHGFICRINLRGNKADLIIGTEWKGVAAEGSVSDIPVERVVDTVLWYNNKHEREVANES